MSEMLEKLRTFLDSEEGKKSIEEWGKKLVREQEHLDRWVEKFKTRCENDLDSTLERLMEKYYSEEYVRREYKRGVEPREPLIWLAWSYAEKYCKPCEDYKYFNVFTGDAYYIGSYVIQIMHGQGSAILIKKIENN